MVIDRDRVRELVGQGAQLVEVLPDREYGEDHIPGAISLPLPQLDRDSTHRLERRRPLIVYCWDSA